MGPRCFVALNCRLTRGGWFGSRIAGSAGDSLDLSPVAFRRGPEVGARGGPVRDLGSLFPGEVAGRGFLIELAGFRGWPAIFVDGAHEHRPVRLADAKVERVADLHFAGRLDRVAVQLDLAAVDGIGGE